MSARIERRRPGDGLESIHAALGADGAVIVEDLLAPEVLSAIRREVEAPPRTRA